jgi:hypothetical protein
MDPHASDSVVSLTHTTPTVSNLPKETVSPNINCEEETEVDSESSPSTSADLEPMPSDLVDKVHLEQAGNDSGPIAEDRP